MGCRDYKNKATHSNISVSTSEKIFPWENATQNHMFMELKLSYTSAKVVVHKRDETKLQKFSSISTFSF